MPRVALVGGAVLAALIVLALAAPVAAPFDPDTPTSEPLAGPSARHLLGTDDIGQDIFSGLLHGARVSLGVGLATGVIATAAGLAVGLGASLGPRWIDAALMRAVDVVLALPFLALLIVLGAFFGGGVGVQITVMSALLWAVPAREVRAQVLSLRERGPVRAALSMGAGRGHLVRWHLAPALAPLAAAQWVRAAGIAILLQASLSFLGLGDPTETSWGTMLHAAQVQGAFLTDAWLWWVLPPGLAIAVTVLSLALVGSSLEGRTRPTTTVAT